MPNIVFSVSFEQLMYLNAVGLRLSKPPGVIEYAVTIRAACAAIIKKYSLNRQGWRLCALNKGELIDLEDSERWISLNPWFGRTEPDNIKIATELDKDTLFKLLALRARYAGSSEKSLAVTIYIALNWYRIGLDYIDRGWRIAKYRQGEIVKEGVAEALGFPKRAAKLTLVHSRR